MKSITTGLLLALATTSTACDLLAAPECTTDDDCAANEVCDDDATCATAPRRPDRDDDEDTGEGEGESLSDLIDVEVTPLSVPATCAGAIAEVVLVVTGAPSMSPTTVAVVPPAGWTTNSPTFDVAANEAVEVRFTLSVPFVVGEQSERVQLFSEGVSSMFVDVPLVVSADFAADAETNTPINDVLLVIENSGSMTDSASTAVQTDVAAFVEALFELDSTRVSVINADGDTNAGVPQRGCSGAATVFSAPTEAQCAINNLWSSFAGSGDERALVAMTTWASTTNTLRSTAQLTIVSIGDSNDNSTLSTTNVASQLAALAPERTQAVSMYSLFDDDETCSNVTDATNHRIGAVTTALGGASGSLCAANDRARVLDDALASMASVTVVPGLPATGEVVACVVDNDVCTIVPGVVERRGNGVTVDLDDGTAVRVMTAETCPL